MRLFTFSLLLFAGVATPNQQYFKLQRAIENVPARGQACVALDAEVFAHAGPDLADLRIYKDGAETPFTIRREGPVQGDEKRITPLNLGTRGGHTVFDAELPETQYSELRLDIGAEDFIATVTLSGGRTPQDSESTKIGSYTIFDLTHQKLGHSTVLYLPDMDLRFLHFVINGPLKPDDIKGISIERLAPGPPKYQLVSETSQVTQKGHVSILKFEVPAYVPVDRVAFTVADQPVLFSREVKIDALPERTTGSVGANESDLSASVEGTLLRVHSVRDGHKIDQEHLALDAPSVNHSRPTRWTVTIDNGDDPPLAIKKVELQMLERKLCFEAAEHGNYVLYYGDPALSAPRYDYATLFTEQADAVRAKLAAEQPNPAYRPRPDERPLTERYPGLLWGALIGVIALLGAIALRSARQA